MSIDPRIEFLSSLYEALADEPRDTADLRDSLERKGVDVDSTLHEARAMLLRHRSKLRLREAKEKLERVQGALSRWVAEGAQSAQLVRDDLARALAGESGSTVYQAYHRKLEAVSEEDLASLGEDAALLEFIARMESGYKE